MFNEKINQIQKYMCDNDIDAYILTKFDPHNSEYGSEKYNPIRFVTGFTGSTATSVVFKDAVGLWVDGRYYIQADEETKDTGITVHKLAQPNVLPYLEYIEKTLSAKSTICFDGTTIPYGDIKQLVDCGKDFKIIDNCEFIYTIWDDRAELLNNEIYEHDIKFAGKSVSDKVSEVREMMSKANVDYFIISQLEDIAWVTNLRGNDVDHSPTFASYCVISKDDVALFIDKAKIGFDENKISKDVKIFDYKSIFEYIDNNINTNKNNVVAINPKVANYRLYTSVDCKVKDLSNDYTTNLKALKNDIELEGLRSANIRDNVALLKLAMWINKNEQEGLSEIEIENKVIACRETMVNYKMPSFSPIVGFNGNGAMMHYKAEAGKCANVKGDGLLLIDSGANYLDGTTDITRTFAIGSVSYEMKKDYTLTLKAMIGLSSAYFLQGATGKQLDIFARGVMWRNKQDYKCGTGHGIGSFLNVHEGPQGVSPRNDVVLEPRMVVTNEPGVYKANKYGIRLENTIVVKEEETNDDGTFFEFETLSFFPFDLRCIDKNIMEQWEIDWLNNYHKETYDKLEQFLNQEEKDWLKNATKEI